MSPLRGSMALYFGFSGGSRPRLYAVAAARLATLICLAWCLSGGASVNAADDFERELKPFLTTYCVECHGPAKQKGERRMDALTGEIADLNALVDLQDVLDQLNLGEMPPAKAKQPTDEERRRVVTWLTARIERFHQERKAPAAQTVLRRLNAREYRNTVRDLLHLEMAMFDPTAGFPRDQTTDHLDNVGESLVTSAHLLERYLVAADRIITKVITPGAKPPVQKWEFHEHFRQQPEIDQVHGKTNGFSHITLYDVVGADKHEGAYGPILAFRQGVPHDGFYELRFKATALNRQHPYDIDFVGTDPNEPLRLGIVAGNGAAGPLHKPQPIEPLLAEMDLADGEQWLTVRVWLDKGYSPRFTFRNGLMDARNLWGRMARKYGDQFPPLTRGGIVEHRFNAIKYGRLPQIHIDEIEIEGPFYDEWPTASHRAVLGDEWESIQAAGAITNEQARTHLTSFASRAYRRPATSDEVQRLLDLMATRQKSGRSPLESYADALKAVLCSPAFLYLDESSALPLTDHALASRLSYCLWSSMPDQRLLDLAAAGQLKQPEVLAAEAERLLTDHKSNSFVDGFLDSWLTLRDLGSSPPDRAKFEEYYRHDLGSLMREETRLFARHLLNNNLSVANFLDADFTFVNKPLAQHYGLSGIEGYEFRHVNLEDHRRGGLLGQASVLTVTANGIDTSPVVRGVWLLENILGTPPSPPPPDVEPLDPDIRGATTIREQLEKHRNVAACYDCHQKIDPSGFALENFDAIGGWREHYGKGKDGDLLRVDPAGQLSDGQAFSDIVGFKALLAARSDQFARCLTEKLLAYSLGRTLAPADRPHVDWITNEAKAKGFGLKDLVLRVVGSEPFRQK
jgi:mono/diheme cytochrome c family protein